MTMYISNSGGITVITLLSGLTSVSITQLFLLVTIYKVFTLIRSNIKYNYLWAIILLFISVLVVFNHTGVLFWSIFIILAELTSTYLVVTILLQYNKKSAKSFWSNYIIIGLLGLMLPSYKTINFFNLYSENSTIITVNYLSPVSILTSTAGTLLIVLIILLTVYVLLLLTAIDRSTSLRDLVSINTGLSTIINTTNSTLNNFLDNFISK